MTPSMIINVVAIVALILALAIVESRRSLERKKMRERLGRMISQPQRRTRFELVDVPKFCPCCGRPMTEPMGRAIETTRYVTREILVCSICLARGPMESAISAAAEKAALTNRTDPARPFDPFSASRATTDMPGGIQHPAGTF